MENKCSSAKLVLFLALFIFVANVEGRRNLEGEFCLYPCPKGCFCVNEIIGCNCGDHQPHPSPIITSDDQRKPLGN
ncbi:hypothetical protein LINPERHAP1_LOCUS20713 [Linum perenne]